MNDWEYEAAEREIDQFESDARRLRQANQQLRFDNARLVAAEKRLRDALEDLDTRIMPEDRKYDEWGYCRVHKDIVYEWDAIIHQALAGGEGGDDD